MGNEFEAKNPGHYGSYTPGSKSYVTLGSLQTFLLGNSADASVGPSESLKIGAALSVSIGGGVSVSCAKKLDYNYESTHTYGSETDCRISNETINSTRKMRSHVQESNTTIVGGDYIERIGFAVNFKKRDFGFGEKDETDNKTSPTKDKSKKEIHVNGSYLLEVDRELEDLEIKTIKNYSDMELITKGELSNIKLNTTGFSSKIEIDSSVGDVEIKAKNKIELKADKSILKSSITLKPEQIELFPQGANQGLILRKATATNSTEKWIFV